MEKIIDLHVHTNFSDGAMTPEEIIDEAIKNKVSVISIADHDTIDAYSKDLFNYANDRHIKLIPAVEISAKTKKAGVHILGYNFDINNQKLKNRLYSLRNVRHLYLRNVANKLQELGYIIDVEELDKIDAVTKAHISLNVITNSENHDLLLNGFGYIPNKGEFIETIMNEGCPAFVKKDSITPIEAAQLIRDAGGKVILAHPVSYKYEDDLRDDEILKIVNDMNADGIEANYIYINREQQKVDEVLHWNSFAKEHNLMVTIGSDFHNHDGIHPEIGLIHEKIKLNAQELEIILNNLLN